MKLYKGTVHVDVLVAADDEEEAIDLAQQHADEELPHCLNDITLVRVTDPADVPKAWRESVVYHSRMDERELEPGEVLREGGDEK